MGVILAAGGRGRRFGRGLPKQFLMLGGKTALERSLEKFSRLAVVKEIVLVVPEEHLRRAARIIRRSDIRKVSTIVQGGAERQDSVRKGLWALSPECTIVLVHDAARPMVSADLIRRVIAGVKRYGTAVPAVRVSDTIKLEGKKGFSTETLRRDLLWAAQTPQGFRRDILERAHQMATQANAVGTDEASLVERIGVPVRIVEGSAKNLKITNREDFALAVRLVSAR